MAEIYSFFDPVLTESGLPDRDYNAQEFTDYFGDLVTTGVMKGKGAELKVTANGSNMIIEIDTGVAFVEGKRYANTAKLAHTHDTETLGKDRIDRIVIRKDLNTDARHVKSFIKKGVPSANPVPPALTQTEMVYEISLAQVKVIGGQTYISAGNVTDERGKEDVCPWAGSNILPNFDAEGLQEVLDKVNGHITNKSNPHNVTTTQVNETLYNPLSAVPPLDYPRGLSMTVVTPEKGFPTWGTVLTVRGSSPSGALQIFTPHDMSLGKTLLIRRGNGNINEWLGWEPIGVTDTGWISATEGPNWAMPSGGFLQYRKVGDLVYVRGKIFGINSTGSIITTLPAGYRPRGIAYVTAKLGHIFVTSAGAMFAGGGVPPNEDVYFDGVYSVV